MLSLRIHTAFTPFPKLGLSHVTPERTIPNPLVTLLYPLFTSSRITLRERTASRTLALLLGLLRGLFFFHRLGRFFLAFLLLVNAFAHSIHPQ